MGISAIEVGYATNNSSITYGLVAALDNIRPFVTTRSFNSVTQELIFLNAGNQVLASMFLGFDANISNYMTKPLNVSSFLKVFEYNANGSVNSSQSFSGNGFQYFYRFGLYDNNSNEVNSQFVLDQFMNGNTGLLSSYLGTQEIGKEFTTKPNSGITIVTDSNIGVVHKTESTEYNDTIYLGSAFNVVRSLGGNDTIYGSLQNDNIDAGGGDDTIYDRGASDGADNLQGGTGFDTVAFVFATSGVTIDTRTGVNLLAGNQFMLSIEGYTGSAHADFIFMNDTDGVANWLEGGGGSDWLGGGDANDTLLGQAGNDSLYGWVGTDILYGEGGNDSLFGEQDNDILYGEADNDGVYGGTGLDQLYGGTGTDTLDGGDDNDSLYGGDGNDALDGGAGTADIAYFETNGEYGWLIDLTLGTARRTNGFGVIDTDTFVNIEQFAVDSGTNAFTGDGNANYFVGGINDDTFAGAGGNDTFYGGVGNDSIDGGSGTGDTVFFETNGAYGWIVNLTLGTAVRTSNGFSAIETDTISNLEVFYINNGINQFVGTGGVNRFFGGAGADLFASGLGSDLIDGRGGIDTVRFAASTSGITSFNGDDVINLATGIATRGVVSQVGLNFFFGTQTTTLSSIEIVRADDGNDAVTGSTFNDSLYGEEGNDTLAGGIGQDSLDGDTGFDFASYLGAAGGVTARLDFASLNTGEAAGDSYVSIEGLIGSAFNDYLVGRDGLGDYLTAQAGDDYLAGRGGNDTIRGDDGNDQFWGGEGADALDGGDGYDIARYDFAATSLVVRLDGGTNTGEATGDTFTGIEALYGSAFGDYLIGDNAGNVLVGLAGGDLLYGLGGNDTLLGGDGADAFAFNTAAYGTDTVLDFKTTNAVGANHDYIDFRGLTLSSFSITQNGADTYVITNHGVVILQNIFSPTLVAGDFLF
jgi:Ca2+-binding RTX toxin-like protein